MTSQAYLETSAAIRILSRKIGKQHGKISQVISLKKTKRNALNAVYDFITKSGKVSRCALFIGKKDIENDIQKQHLQPTTDTLEVCHLSSSNQESHYRAFNHSKGTSYDIYLDRYASRDFLMVRCSCPDNRWRQRPCKHIDAVRRFLGLDNIFDFFQTPAPPAPKRNWPSERAYADDLNITAHIEEQELREAYDALGF